MMQLDEMKYNITNLKHKFQTSDMRKFRSDLEGNMKFPLQVQAVNAV